MKYLKKYNEEIDWEWMDEEEYPIVNDFKGNEDFYNFLKDNNALEKWIDNFNKQKEWKENWVGQGLNDIIKYLKSQYKQNFIMNSFLWEKTPEDNEFWKELHNKWRSLKQNENIDWNWLDEEEYPIPDDFKGNKDFYNFLKDNDVLEKWLTNFNNKTQKEWRIRYNIFNKYEIFIIKDAFKWDKTPEGHFFWMDLNYKWEQKILSKK